MTAQIGLKVAKVSTVCCGQRQLEKDGKGECKNTEVEALSVNHPLHILKQPAH